MNEGAKEIVGYSVFNRMAGNLMELNGLFGPEGCLMVFGTEAGAGQARFKWKADQCAIEPVYFGVMTAVLITGDGYDLDIEAARNWNKLVIKYQTSLLKDYGKMMRYSPVPLPDNEHPDAFFTLRYSHLPESVKQAAWAALMKATGSLN